MSDDAETAARLAALEMRIAHQDATIEALNLAVTEQWRTIDALARAVASLADRVQDFGGRDLGGDPGRPEPPPPHY